MPENRDRLFDRRVVERYIEKGLVKDTEFKEYIKNLPDEQNNAQWVQMDLHDAEISEGTEGEIRDEEDESGSKESEPTEEDA